MQRLGVGLVYACSAVLVAAVLISLVALRCRQHAPPDDPPVVEPAPVGPTPRSWFRFEEPSGDVLDSGLAGRHGRAVGIERHAAGRVGHAARFPASHERAAYVIVDEPAPMAWTKLSVSAWVFLEDRGGFNLVGNYGRPGGDGFVFGMLDRSLSLTLGYYPSCDGMTTWPDRSRTEIPLGKWTHVAFALDLTAHRVDFYLDGRRTSTDTIYDNNVRLCDRHSPLRIGPFMTEGAHPYSARIDEVKIFDLVLDEQQIREQARQRP